MLIEIISGWVNMTSLPHTQTHTHTHTNTHTHTHTHTHTDIYIYRERESIQQEINFFCICFRQRLSQLHIYI